MLDIATFRANFPEFADSTKYTDAAITLWMSVGNALLSPNADRWGTVYDTALSLFIAHHLAIAAADLATVAAGGVPGQVQGPISSKTVDRVTVVKDTGAVTLEDGDFWNMTRYGIELLHLARLLGAGGLQLQ